MSLRDILKYIKSEEEMRAELQAQGYMKTLPNGDIVLTQDFSKKDKHDSDCSTNNAPAFKNGECDCSLSNRIKVIDNELYYLLTPTSEPLRVARYNLYNLMSINLEYLPYKDNDSFTKNILIQKTTYNERILLLEFLLKQERKLYNVSTEFKKHDLQKGTNNERT